MEQFIPKTEIEKYFAELSKYPRESFHEKAVSDYVVSFAKEHNFRYVQDEMYNVIVYKDASPGYEKKDAVILEAHMDMVCIKETHSTHNFDTDPIVLLQEGDILHADGTTLGADDGYGCAMMLGILADDSLKHPALECVFTVQEETDTGGAMGLDKSLLKGKTMIGLDCASEEEPYVGSFCSWRLVMERRYDLIKEKGNVYSLQMKDLNGKVLHGICNADCGNAVKIGTRILETLNEKDGHVRIVSFNGGTMENHIPVNAEVVFVSDQNYENVKQIAENTFSAIRKEYLSDAYTGDVIVEEKEDREYACMSEEDSASLLDFLYLLPNNKTVSGCEDDALVALANIGILRMEDGTVSVTMNTRARMYSASYEIERKCRKLSSLYQFSYTSEERYASWPHDENSRVRRIADEIHTEDTGHPYGMGICPGGLEIGIFIQAIEGLDAMELGVNHYDLHTTKERMELSSFNRSYDTLVRILERL